MKNHRAPSSSHSQAWVRVGNGEGFKQLHEGINWQSLVPPLHGAPSQIASLLPHPSFETFLAKFGALGSVFFFFLSDAGDVRTKPYNRGLRHAGRNAWLFFSELKR
jgi:hypothetical protein